MSVAIKIFPEARVRWTLRRILSVMLVGSIVILAGAKVSKAADDEEADDTFDTKFMRNFLTNMGLRQGNEPGIDYHERSPLVVPPTHDLPPPESASSALSRNDAMSSYRSSPLLAFENASMRLAISPR